MRYFSLSIIVLILQCQVFTTWIQKRGEMTPLTLVACPIPIEQGKMYGNHGKKADTEQIVAELKLLLDDICQGNLNHLPGMVFGELGLFIDIKGHWTKEEVIRDLASKEGYFATYFFDQQLLDKKKGAVGNLTIQTALRSSHGLVIDYFFDSETEAELQLKFKENPKNARYLINPVFAKMEGKWMLLRML